MNTADAPKYPLLEEVLNLRGLPLLAIFSTRDLARIFNVSARAMQNRIASGDLKPRDLPGRGKFFPSDVEGFLAASQANVKK